MKSADAIFNWWFHGVGGLGGWVLFLILVIAAIVYVFVDATQRKVSAIGWKLGAALPILLLLPSLVWRFSSSEVQASLLNLQEMFFILVVVGGIVPVASAIGYAVNYMGYTPPEPTDFQEEVYRRPPPPPPPPPPLEPAPPLRPHANAWLVEVGTNRTYQLFQGDTRLGRSKQNDIAFTDPSVSREHALIREERGHFTIYDRGAKTGVYINGKRLRQPMLLDHGDEIEMGDSRLRFVTAR